MALASEPLEGRRVLSVTQYSIPSERGTLSPASPAWFATLNDLEPSLNVVLPGSDTRSSSAILSSSTAPIHASQEWIVRLTEGALAGVSSVTDAAAHLRSLPLGLEVVRGLGLPGQVLVRAAGAADDVRRYLGEHVGVAHFSPNSTVSVAATPNDPDYSKLYGLHNTGQTGGVADADIDAAEAWDRTTGSSSIVVGVIDTGIDWSHVDLAGNMWTNPGEVAGDGVDNDANGFVDDVYGYDFVNNDGDPMDDHSHGTHCAGTIGATGNNGTGVVGVSWDVSLMGLKFLSSSGSGTLANAIRAVNYATMMRSTYGVNVRVTSNSWGGGGFDQGLLDAINAGGAAGILFVAAAGNSGMNTDTSPAYPASYDSPYIVSVAATDHADGLAGFSNYGPKTVDLGAPGVDTYSTMPGNSYGSLSGTSMATPHVSGAAVLALAVDPTLSVTALKDSLLNTVDAIPSLAGKTVTGGRLNAATLVNSMGLGVFATTPAVGAVVTTVPSEYIVTFNDAFVPASVSAADLLVNGIAAASASIVDSKTIKFSFASSPVLTQGLQTMGMPIGALTRASDATPSLAFTGTFRFDTAVQSVVDTTPSNGAIAILPRGYIDIRFREAVDPTSISPSDLQITAGSVTGASLNGADTVRFLVSGLDREATVTLSLASGAVTDLYGNPSTAYSGSFSLDVDSAPFPVPLKASGPLGSLMYSGSHAGALTSLAGVASSTIAIFDNPLFTDPPEESALLTASLAKLGYTTTSFSGLTASDWKRAISGASLIVIPELDRGDLLPSLPADTQVAIRDFVGAGGGLITLLTNRGPRASRVLNGVFGFSLGTEVNLFGVSQTLKTAAATGTAFAGGPGSLPGVSATMGIPTSSLPPGSRSLYESGSATSVFTAPYGSGLIACLGFDWYATPTPADWETVLGSAVRQVQLVTGDSDAFTIDLDANQLLSLTVAPSTALPIAVKVLDPSNAVIASITGTGGPVTISGASVTAAGTYRIVVSGSPAAGTTAPYSVGVDLNSVYEGESATTGKNDTFATARPLDSEFRTPTRGPSQTAVRASIALNPMVSDGFESAGLGSSWSTYSSDAGGRIQVTGAYGTASGGQALLMDRGPDDGIYTLNEAVLRVDLAGATSAVLSFAHRAFNDENEAFSGPFTGHFNADGVAISADGLTWYPAWNASGGASAWESHTVDLSAVAAAAGIPLGSAFQIKFQQYDNFAINTDGRGWDDIQIATVDPNDFYSVTLATGETLSISIADTSKPVTFDLLSPATTRLATAVTTTPGFAAMLDAITASAAGTYFIKVTSPTATAYSLVVTKNGAFDFGGNDSLSTAQLLAGNASGGYHAAGHVVAGGGTTTALTDTSALAGAESVTARWFATVPSVLASSSQFTELSEWIVRLTDTALGGVSAVSEAAAFLRSVPLGLEVVQGLGLPGQVLVRAAAAVSDVERYLSEQPGVAYFTRNTVLNVSATPNDPEYSKLYGLHNVGQTGGVVDADIDAPEAWDRTTGHSSIVVGVIDTGIDWSHVDLAGNMWTNPGEVAGNGMDDDANGFVDDVHGYDFVNNDGDPMDDHYHGTHVAGTIGATGNNGTGVVGVSWDVSLMGLKFLSSGGFGSSANAIRAINYATMMRQMYGVNVRVTNNSWGGGGFDQNLLDAINAGGAAGILFVAAAGNNGRNTDTSPHYPSSYDSPSIVSVAATDHADGLASFSNYGAKSVDLGAPGVNTYSTMPGNAYGALSGTSMAAPHASGAAALALAVDPMLSVTGLKNALLNSVDALASLAGKTVTGGRLNAATLVNSIRHDEDDFYAVPVKAGDTLVIETATPSDGIGEYVNGLNPRVELFSPTGISLVSDDDSAPDGRNALIIHKASADGLYRVRVASTTGSGEYSISVLGATGRTFTLTEDFDPTVDASFWQQIDEGTTGTQFTGSASNALVFGFTGSGTRQAITKGFNLTAGGTVSFQLIIGNSSNGGENADPGEDIVLEYTTDGVNFSQIATYLESSYPAFTTITQQIPLAAQTTNTQFRWRQTSHSGSGYDQWAIDNISIGTATPPPPPTFTSTEDFDPTVDASFWQQIDEGTTGTQFTGSASNALVFGFTGSGTRQAITKGFNLTAGGTVSFQLIIGNSSNGGENADPGEDIVLEYTTDGVNFSQIATYLESSYPAFTTITQQIPLAAQTANTQFRWRQPSHSGSSFDQWAIDNISIGTATPPPPPTFTSTEDFDPTVDASFWQQIDEGTTGTQFTGSASNALVFGFTGSGTRQAITKGFNLTAGGTVSFQLIIGNSSNGGENADPGEDIVLEYTTDGVNFSQIATYLESSYPAFTTITQQIPLAAQTANTQFRWRQPSHSGSSFDQWAIDNISIGTATHAPTDINLSPSLVAENQPVGTVIGTLSTTDVDAGDSFTYSLVSGTGDADNASFTIVGNTLKTAASFNYEVKSSYSIRVRSIDAGGLTTEKLFTIFVSNVNEAPTDIALSANSVAENSSVGTAVGTLSTTDPDAGDSFTYSLVSGTGDADNASFMIVGNTLKTAASFNYEVKSSYSIRVRSIDAGGLPTEKLFTIFVSNVNEAPTDIALSATTVEENQPVGTVIGTLSTTDVDAGDSFTYSLVSGTGDADNASFTIVGNTLKTAASFNYEVKSSYSIRVRSIDAGGLTTEKLFTIFVSNVNEAPTDIALSANSVAENSSVGTAVGTLSTTDPDAGDSFTYSLVSGTGDADNASFMIVGNTLKTAASFNYEVKSSYSIRVRSIDAGGLTTEKLFTIFVSNVNEAPTDIALSANSVAENSSVGTAVGTLSTTDPDAGDSFTYSLVSGTGDADNASFMIVGNTLKTAASFNYEVKSSYSIRVRSIDAGGLPTEKLFTIFVSNVNEAPTDIALSATTVEENQPVGTVIGTLSTTDVDAGDSFTYSLVSGTGDADNASFTIVGNTLKTAASFNYEVKSSYSIRVRSIDAGGLPTEKQFSISVTGAAQLRVTALTPTASGFTATFNRAIVGSDVNLYDQSGALGAADVTLVGATAGAVSGSLVIKADGSGLTFLRSGSALPSDTYTVTLRSATTGFHDATGELLDGNSDGAAGGDYTTTFVVAQPADVIVVGVADFARGAGQAVKIPATGVGLPLVISSGQNVSGLDFTLNYDPALLTVTDFLLEQRLVAAGVQVAINAATPGHAVVSIFSTTSLSTFAGSLTVGHFVASVPQAAAYAAKQVLDIQNLVVYDDASGVPGVRSSLDDDAIHVAAYFGDLNANRLIQANDAILAARMTTGINTGLSAYQMADPVIVSDINSNNRIQSNDAIAIARSASGTAVAEIPIIPTAFPAPATGLDPILQIGSISGALGATITVPVTVEIPSGQPAQAFSGFDLALAYDAAKLTFVSIAATSFTTGFSVTPNTGFGSGVLAVSAFTSGQTATIDPTSGVRVLANITFTINAAAAVGTTTVNLLADYASLQFTALFDSDTNEAVLNPAPTNASTDSVDGIVTIQASNQSPTDIALSATSVAENALVGTTVGTLSTTDADAGDTFTYSLVAGTGDADNASFTVVGNQLTTAASFNYNTKSSYSIRARSADAGGLATEKQFTIGVVDTTLPSAPTITRLGATVTVAGLEAESSWQYSLDNGITWQTGSGGIFGIPAVDTAANQIQVRQTDKAGNTSLVSGLASGVTIAAMPLSTRPFDPAGSQKDTRAQAMVDLSAGSSVGLYARYSVVGGKVNLYQAYLNKAGAGFNATIVRFAAGVGAVVKTVATPSGKGLLEFNVVGSTLSLFLDGKLLTCVIDNSVAGPGTAGTHIAAGASLSQFLASGLTERVALSNKSFDGGVAERDMRVQAMVDIATGTGAGLYARYSVVGGKVNLYQAYLRKAGSGYIATVVRFAAGVGTVITNVAAPTGKGLLQLDTIGSTLSLSLDGKLLVSLTDASVAGPGTAGTYISTGSSASQFSIARLVPLAPSPTVGITSGVTKLRANETATVSFSLSSGATDFLAGDVALAGGTLSNFQRLSATNYSATFTPTAGFTGSGTVNVAAGAFTNAAGITNSPATTLQFAIDTAIPTQPTITRLGATVTVAGLEAESSWQYSLDNGTTWQTGSGGIFGIPAVDTAANQIQVRQTDKAGNTSLVSGLASGVTIAAMPLSTRPFDPAGSQKDTRAQAMVDLSAGSSVGLYARYSVVGGKVNLYQAYLNKAGAGFNATIVRFAAGVGAVVKTVATPSGKGLLEFNVVGSTLSLFLDGKLLTCVIDNSVAGPGTAGTHIAAGASLSQFLASGLTERVALSNKSFDGGVAERDMRVQAMVDIATGTGAGLYARYSVVGGKVNLYQAYLRKAGSGYIATVVRFAAGVGTVITNVAAPTGKGLLQLDTVGSTLSLSLDGKLLASLTDASVAGPGTAGTYISTGSSASQFSISKLMPITP
jgi:subtilisin family serine protease